MNRCIISKFCYFAGNYPASLPPGADHVTPCGSGSLFSNMATAGSRVITAQEIELISFIKQNIVRKLLELSSQWGLPVTNPKVTQAVSQYFNCGLAPHQIFDNLVWQIAQSLQVSNIQVTPQVRTLRVEHTRLHVRLLPEVMTAVRPSGGEALLSKKQFRLNRPRLTATQNPRVPSCRSTVRSLSIFRYANGILHQTCRSLVNMAAETMSLDVVFGVTLTAAVPRR